jgi:diguanylate cyclase (GGDEF)-like protein/PAS domain S-box-containing protein
MEARSVAQPGLPAQVGAPNAASRATDAVAASTTTRPSCNNGFRILPVPVAVESRLPRHRQPTARAAPGPRLMRGWAARAWRIGACWLLLGAAGAGAVERAFERYGVDDGLHTAAVYALAQDRRGFLWISGASDALYGFDGSDFRALPLAEGEAQPAVDTGAMLVDDQDRLWVGSWGAGLFLLGSDRRVLQRFRHDPAVSDSLPNDRVQVLYRDRGTLWVGTAAGLARIDADGTLQRVALPSGSEAGEPRIWSITGDADGLWVGSAHGLVALDPGRGTARLHRPRPRAAAASRDNEVRAVLRAGNGTLWVGTRNGLLAFDEAQDRFVALPQAPRLQVNVLLEVDNTLLVGTQSGIRRVDPHDGRPVAGDDPLDAVLLGGSDIRALLEDRSGVLWAGSRYGGLFRGPRSGQFETLQRIAPALPARLGERSVTALHVDAAERIWLGSAEGVIGIAPHDGRLATVTTDTGQPLPGLVTGIGSDRDGTLWIATERGLFRLPEGESRAQPVDTPFDALGIASPSVRAIAFASDGALLLGLWGHGAVRWWPQQPARAPEWLIERLGETPGDAVYAITEGADGSLWIGARYSGLYRVDPDGSVEHFHSRAGSRSLPSDAVRCVHEAADRSLWVCTDHGLARRIPGQRGFSVHGEQDGLPGELIAAVQDDASGRLWVATDAGLARLDPASGEVVAFRQADGLPASEFNRGALAFGPAGRLHAGTVAGFAHFDPLAIRYNAVAPHVAITGIEVDGQRFDPLQLAADAPLQVPRRTRRLTIEFAALDYNDPDANQHRYRLLGFETGWRTATARSASYTSLPAGEFRFEVVGSNNHGIWSAEPVVLALSVPPAWWESPLLLSLVAAAALLLVGTVPVLLNRRLRARARSLERMVAQRTAELAERNLSLEEAQARARLGSWEWHAANDTGSWSDGLYRIFGFAPGAIEPSLRTLLPMIHADDRDAVVQQLQHCLRSGDAYHGEFRFERPDGAVVRLHARGGVVRDAEGDIVGMAGTVQDITEQANTLAALRTSEERFRSAFEYSAAGFALITPDGRWMKVNPSMCRIVGYPEAELLDTPFQRITVPEDVPGDEEASRRLLAGEVRSYSREKRYVRKDGSHVWVLLTVSLVRDDDGVPLYFVSQVQDINERKRAEAALQDTLARLNEAQRIGRTGDWTFDPASGAMTWSPSLYVLFERDPQRGRPTWHEHLACFDADSRALLKERVAALRADGRPQEYELRAELPSGRGMVVHTRAFASHDADGQVVRLHGVLQDVTERKRADAELRAAAETDFLTGACNRRFLFDAGQRELERCQRQGLPFSLIGMDIDHFKQINDRHGHEAGDRVLVAVAARIRDAIRGSDVFARVGGEEFVLILPGTSLATATQIAEKMRAMVRELPVTTIPEPLRITASFGVATDQGGTLDSLLRTADAAMYEAKQGGRDRVCVRPPRAAVDAAGDR